MCVCVGIENIVLSMNFRKIFYNFRTRGYGIREHIYACVYIKMQIFWVVISRIIYKNSQKRKETRKKRKRTGLRFD